MKTLIIIISAIAYLLVGFLVAFLEAKFGRGPKDGIESEDLAFELALWPLGLMTILAVIVINFISRRLKPMCRFINKLAGKEKV